MSAGPHPYAVAWPAGTRPSDAIDGGRIEAPGAVVGGGAPAGEVVVGDVVAGDVVVEDLAVRPVVGGGAAGGDEVVDDVAVGDLLVGGSVVVADRPETPVSPAKGLDGADVSCPDEMVGGDGERAASTR